VEVSQRERTLVTPFWVRLASETSFSAGWPLIVFPAVLYPLYLALEALFGRGTTAAMDFAGDFQARGILLFAVCLGYVAMMYTYVARGTIRDIETLRPVLRGGEAVYADLRSQLTQFERHRLWIGGLTGFAFTFVFQELVVARWTRLVAEEWSLRDPYSAAILIAFWVTGGRGAVYLIDSARTYSQIGERHVAVDLLDLGPLSPLTRHGLRIVLLLTIVTAAGVLALVVPAPYSLGLTVAAVAACAWNSVLAVVVFALPVRGLRRQIRARKAEELARVREEIRLDRDLVARRESGSAEAGARLPGLLAYAKTIESVREWPFDAPTLTRFFLYVAIPIGSWIGGALVERLLGAALD
jgi:hypothetical protein